MSFYLSHVYLLCLWGEGASLALFGHPSSDAITIKIPYWVDVLLHRPAIALDISKAFDRVWHAGLLHKLRSYRISG